MIWKKIMQNIPLCTRVANGNIGAALSFGFDTGFCDWCRWVTCGCFLMRRILKDDKTYELFIPFSRLWGSRSNCSEICNCSVFGVLQIWNYRGGGRCKILGVLMNFPCGTFLQSRNIVDARCLYFTYFKKYWGFCST